MRRSVAIPLLLLLMACATASDLAAEICQWTDENGVTHQCAPSAGPSAPATKQAARSTAASSAQPPAGPSPKTFEIPYQDEGSTKRVIIPVTFNDTVTAPMALDTGSPGLVMCVDLAKRLRLFSQGKGNLIVANGGIGGTAPGILTITDS